MTSICQCQRHTPAGDLRLCNMLCQPVGWQCTADLGFGKGGCPIRRGRRKRAPAGGLGASPRKFENLDTLWFIFAAFQGITNCMIECALTTWKHRTPSNYNLRDARCIAIFLNYCIDYSSYCAVVFFVLFLAKFQAMLLSVSSIVWFAGHYCCLPSRTTRPVSKSHALLGQHPSAYVPEVAFMSGLSLETYTPNLKSVALTVLEFLAFNAQKFRGPRDPGHAPFSKKLRDIFALSI